MGGGGVINKEEQGEEIKVEAKIEKTEEEEPLLRGTGESESGGEEEMLDPQDAIKSVNTSVELIDKVIRGIE